MVSYDWRRAIPAAARLWSYGAEHIFGLDSDGRTWGGDAFVAPDDSEIRRALHAAGLAPHELNALRTVRAPYYRAGVPPSVLETEERNDLSRCASHWPIFNLDADEELVNPDEFFRWVEAQPPLGAFAWSGRGVPVYKVIGDTALVFRTNQRIPLALGRAGIWTGPRSCRDWLDCPAKIINWFMAGRTDDELALKFGAMSYIDDTWWGPALFAQWRGTTLDNYQHVRGFAKNFGQAPLVAIPVEDLRAGRWDALERPL